jgi:hypothetical protein
MMTFDFGKYWTGEASHNREAVYSNIPMERLVEFRMRYKGYKVRYRGPRDTKLDIVVRQRGVLNRQSNCLKANATNFSVYTTGL